MNREEGLHIGRQVRALLLQRGYPIRKVVLFGSVANNTAHRHSDIDLAVITDAFHASPMEESVDIHLASMTIDPRIETVTLRPDDFDQPFFTLAREIERTGSGCVMLSEPQKSHADSFGGSVACATHEYFQSMNRLNAIIWI